MGLTGLLGDLMSMLCLGWSMGDLCLYGSERGSGLDLLRSEAGDLSWSGYSGDDRVMSDGDLENGTDAGL